MDWRTVYRWESGENTPRRASLKRIAKATGVRQEWLETGEGDPGGASTLPTAPRSNPPDQLDTILVIPTTPAGHGASLAGRDNNGHSEPARIPEAQVRLMTGGHIPRYPDGSPRLVLSHAVGDSMAPFIPNGHPILYEPEADLVDGARYALWLGDVDADVVKRIRLLPGGGVMLVSDNQRVPPLTLFPTEEPDQWEDEHGRGMRLRVQGRVLFPFDTAPAVMAELADFARSLLRP